MVDPKGTDWIPVKDNVNILLAFVENKDTQILVYFNGVEGNFVRITTTFEEVKVFYTLQEKGGIIDISDKVT